MDQSKTVLQWIEIAKEKNILTDSFDGWPNDFIKKYNDKYSDFIFNSLADMVRSISEWCDFYDEFYALLVKHLIHYENQNTLFADLINKSNAPTA